jgi:hypothetical protein
MPDKEPEVVIYQRGNGWNAWHLNAYAWGRTKEEALGELIFDLLNGKNHESVTIKKALLKVEE